MWYIRFICPKSMNHFCFYQFHHIHCITHLLQAKPLDIPVENGKDLDCWLWTLSSCHLRKWIYDLDSGKDREHVCDVPATPRKCAARHHLITVSVSEWGDKMKFSSGSSSSSLASDSLSRKSTLCIYTEVDAPAPPCERVSYSLWKPSFRLNTYIIVP